MCLKRVFNFKDTDGCCWWKLFVISLSFIFAGFALVRVELDCHFWNIMLDSFVWLGTAPEFLTKRLRHKKDSEKMISVIFSIINSDVENNKLIDDQNILPLFTLNGNLSK